MPVPTLISLSFSPWSEQARWALEARGIEYQRKRYEPLLGEPGLRRLTKTWRGPVSVPVLLADNAVLNDSWDIARWAAERGTGPDLVPDESVVGRWRARAQDGLCAGRTLSLARVVRDVDALDELTSPPLRVLGPIGRAVTRAGVHWTRRKYDAGSQSVAEQNLRGVLDEVREALDRDDEGTILGRFSYADITCAQVMALANEDLMPTGKRETERKK